MKKLWVILAALGIILGFGTASASDAGLLTAGDVAIRAMLSFGFILTAFLGYRIQVLNQKLRRMRRALAAQHSEVVSRGEIYCA